MSGKCKTDNVNTMFPRGR